LDAKKVFKLLSPGIQLLQQKLSVMMPVQLQLWLAFITTSFTVMMAAKTFTAEG
jgi:hypothetical protein